MDRLRFLTNWKVVIYRLPIIFVEDIRKPKRFIIVTIK